MRSTVRYVALLILAALAGCSQYSTRPLPRFYHNVNARFNAYYIAKNRLIEAENALFAARKDNYNVALPILLPVDSTAAKTVQASLDDAVKRASLVLQRHQNSRWVDDAYVVIGRARLLRQDLGGAADVFRYVNTKAKDADARHAALNGLLRTYIEQGNLTNANTVAEALRSEPLNRPNTVEFYLTKAYLHQRQGQNALAAAILDETFPLLKKGETTARLYYIAGQLYDQLGQPAKAADRYRAVLRNRPAYEQRFFASLNLLDGTTANATVQEMLTDRKNAQLKDQLWSTLGQIEERRGRVDEAITNYKKAVQTATPASAQAAYAYLALGRLYFEKKQQYAPARLYYDSAAASLPRETTGFAAIEARRKLLEEWSQATKTITLQDSLQRLAQLPPAQLDSLLTRIARQPAPTTPTAKRSGPTTAPATTSNVAPADRWELYNPVRLAQGKQEFGQRWGGRPLEDNWRRSNKSANPVAAASTPAAPGRAADAVPVAGSPATLTAPNSLTGSQSAGVVSPTDSVGGLTARKAELLAQLPRTVEAQQRAQQAVETAYYQLGKVYRFGFERPTLAVATFETLLGRFPNTPYKAEVYYLLALTQTQLGGQPERRAGSVYRDRLLAEFPTSSYAGQLARAEAGTSGQNATATSTERISAVEAEKRYANVYALYQQERYVEAMPLADALLAGVAGLPIADKTALLRAMLVGQVQGADAYQQALEGFLRDYPASTLLPRAREMLAVAQRSKRQ